MRLWLLSLVCVVASATLAEAATQVVYPTGVLLVGRSGSVIDLGTANRVTGFTKGGHGGPGPQIRDALAAKHELLRQILGSGHASQFAE